MATVINLQNSFQQAAISNYASHRKNIYIIPDRHLAGGINKNGNFSGTENLYADHLFGGFINFLQTQLEKQKGVLVINGDFIDFLRITDLPNEEEILAWLQCWNDDAERTDVMTINDKM